MTTSVVNCNSLLTILYKVQAVVSDHLQVSFKPIFLHKIYYQIREISNADKSNKTNERTKFCHGISCIFRSAFLSLPHFADCRYFNFRMSIISISKAYPRHFNLKSSLKRPESIENDHKISWKFRSVIRMAISVKKPF